MKANGTARGLLTVVALLAAGTVARADTPFYATRIAAGGDNTCLVKADGTVWACGANYSGQIGNGTSGGVYARLVQVSDIAGVTHVAVGGGHTVALKSDGTVWAWGDSYYRQLGDGTNITRLKPVQVSGLTGVVAIAAGQYHSVALKGDGTVWAWGNNSSGQLGDMTPSVRLTPGQMFIIDNTPPIARMLRTYCPPNASVTSAPVYYDPDLNGPWTAVVVSNAAHGTVTGGANLVYTPNADFQGVDSFQYLVNDGETNSNVATGYVNVRAYGKPAGMLVDIVVNDLLYTVLSNEVQRLKTDLTNEGYTAIITPVSSGTSAGELWTNLNSIYQTTNWLVGALFVGNIAKMTPGGGPCSDGYYWNMQTFQTSAGKVGSHDIWVGRFTIDASGDSNLYGTEVDLIRYALDANHYYRTGQSRLPNTAYVHVGNDWGGNDQATTEVSRAKQVWTNAFVDSNADGILNGANGSDLICETSHGSAGDYSAGMSKAGAHAGLVQSRAMFCTSCESGYPNGVVNHQLFSRGGGNLFSVGATTTCNPYNYAIFRDYDWPWPPWAAFRALLGAGETWGHAMLQRYPLVDSDGSSVASDTMIYGDLSMRPLATPSNAVPSVVSFTKNCTTVYVGQPVTFSVGMTDADGAGAKSPYLPFRHQAEWFMAGYNYGKNSPTYTTDTTQGAGWTNQTHTFTVAGTNLVRAEVMDEWRARSYQELTVTVLAWTPPTCSPVGLDSPVVKAGTNLTLTATAASAITNISKVEFYCDGAQIGASTGTPSSCVWSNVPTGQHALTARAIDSVGVVCDSPVAVYLLVTASGQADGAPITGGIMTNYVANGTNYTAHILSASAQITVWSNVTVQYLVVAGGGGGGGGYNGGGGGAGGVRTGTMALATGSYIVTVGAGGYGNRALGVTAASNGLPSSIVGDGVTVTTTGGGHGNGEDYGVVPVVGNYDATPGGSGGGTAAASNKGAGELGNVGGIGDQHWPGGGGGATSAGSLISPIPARGRSGGTGYVCAYSGVSVTYAEGGYGTPSRTRDIGQSGAPNTGTGGDGAGNNSGNGIGGNGGSGIVILRYVTGGYEAWRQTYFDSNSLTNSAISGPTADPDHDGLNNEQEFLAGTDPTNASSCLAIIAPTNNPVVAGGGFVVRWQSVTGKTYSVLAATNLMTGFSALTNALPATPTVNVYTDKVNGAGQKFYRVGVE